MEAMVTGVETIDHQPGVATMSVDEAQSYVFKYENDKFANELGIQLVSFSDGRAVARMAIKDNLTNALKWAHGGAIFTLADLAFAAASNSAGMPAVAISATINYVKAIKAGVLTATAKALSSKKKIATYSVKVTDEENDLVATFLGTAYKKTRLSKTLK